MEKANEFCKHYGEVFSVRPPDERRHNEIFFAIQEAILDINL